jgi:hypothetical protein
MLQNDNIHAVHVMIHALPHSELALLPRNRNPQRRMQHQVEQLGGIKCVGEQ